MNTEEELYIYIIVNIYIYVTCMLHVDIYV